MFTYGIAEETVEEQEYIAKPASNHLFQFSLSAIQAGSQVTHIALQTGFAPDERMCQHRM